MRNYNGRIFTIVSRARVSATAGNTPMRQAWAWQSSSMTRINCSGGLERINKFATNVQYMTHCDACHRPRWSKPMNGQTYCGLSLDHILSYIILPTNQSIHLHTFINSLGWCIREILIHSITLWGAGFWPLAGCSASQPLPKMWEDWIQDPNVSQPGSQWFPCRWGCGLRGHCDE